MRKGWERGESGICYLERTIQTAVKFSIVRLLLHPVCNSSGPDSYYSHKIL